MHLPISGEESVDVIGGEEIGRAVGAVEHPQFPFAGKDGERGLRRFASPAATAIAAQMQHITRQQSARRMSAELTKRKGRRAAQIGRHIKPAGK